MALETPQETLAKFLTRLHQDAKEFSLVGNEQRQALSMFWERHDSDLAVGRVPAQTFTSGEDGTHYYAGFSVGEKWYLGVIAWLRPERAVNPAAKARSHIVAAIPMDDDDHVLSTLRVIAQNTAESTISPVADDPFAK